MLLECVSVQRRAIVFVAEQQVGVLLGVVGVDLYSTVAHNFPFLV